MDVQELLQKCTVDGLVLKLPPGTLEFKIFSGLKKHLDQLGGKWNGGRIQGFVFEQDPSHLVGKKIEPAASQSSMFAPAAAVEEITDIEMEPEVEGIMPIVETFIPEPVNQSSIKDDDMNFFRQLLAVGNVDMTMRMMEKNGKLTIMIMPGSGSATIPPINITGTPEELDEKFFSVIAPGVNAITGMVSNIEDVKKEIAETATVEKKPAESKAPATKPKAATEKTKKKVNVGKATPEVKETEPVIEEPAAAE
jgi:PRTRC genetic system protein E